MIVIDIYVPVMGKTYDFSVDENTSIKTITDDIVDLIIQKEGFFEQQAPDCRLFFPEKHCILNYNNTLNTEHVENGDRLILV